MFEKLPLVLDGATGTELQKRGLPPGVLSEQWILENPDKIIELQRGYAEAGAQIIMVPTFTLNRPKLEAHGVDADIFDCARRLVALTREASEGYGVMAAGDMSPTGLTLVPYGGTEFDEIVEIYREQAQALDAAGVDAFLIETSLYIGEARAAVLAIREVSGKPILVSFSCNDGGRSLYGGDMLSAMTVMSGMGVSAFGLNCCGNIDTVCREIKRLAEYAPIPLIAKPNAGKPRTVGGRDMYDMTPDDMFANAKRMLDAGALLVGGCCGTTRKHIARVAEACGGYTPAAQPDKKPLLCSTEREAFELSDNIADVDCGEDIAGDSDAKRDDGFMGMRLSLTDGEALDCFLDSAVSFKLPPYLVCDDEALLEKALRGFHGRAVWCGGAVDSRALSRLADMYGLILL